MRKIGLLMGTVMMMVTALVIQFMPEKVPMHYDASGKIDRWGSRAELLLLPGVMVVLGAVFWLISGRFLKKAENAANEKDRAAALSNARVMDIVSIAVQGMEAVLVCFMLYKAFVESRSGAENLELDELKVMTVLMGILFVVLGNFMPKTRRNGAVGFRCGWSEYNDLTWSRSNRFAGGALMAAGVLSVITGLLAGSGLGVVMLVVYLMVATGVSLWYSKRVYDEEKSKETDS